MSNTTLSLALRIAQLIAENSEKEMRSAINLLRAHGAQSDLLNLLACEPVGPHLSEDASLKSGPSTPRNSLENTTSLAVLQLRDRDPEKYRLLAEFDKLVRRGQALVTHEDLRRFGEHVSKNFQPRKSRKDTIGHLLATMAEKSLSDIEQLIDFATSFGVAGDTDEYQRLAQFLIKGKGSNPL